MKNIETWSQLRDEQTALVPEYQALRRKMGDLAVHYFDQDSRTTYLAIRDTSPYGALDQRSTTSRNKHILQPVGGGTDYVIFGVPDELLSLEALTCDASADRVALLKPVYRQIGQLICSVEHEVKPSQVGVEDIAFDRAARAVVLLPPVHFMQADVATTEMHQATFLRSMAATFEHVLTPNALQELSNEVLLGAYL